MARSKQDSLLSLPHVELIDGKTYVRLAYFDERAGKRRSKTRRVHSVSDYGAALDHLRRQIGAQPSDYDPERMTFEELMKEFRKAKTKMKEWYAAPLEVFFRQASSERPSDIRSPASHWSASINREMETLR